MFQSFRTPLVYSLAFLMTTLPAFAQTSRPIHEEAAAASSPRLLMQMSDGEILTQKLDSLGYAPSHVEGLSADGFQDVDALQVFEAQSFETTSASDGSLLAFERRGNQLVRTYPSVEDGVTALSVRWNDALDTLFIDLGLDRYVLQIEGVVNPLVRARHLARLAVLTLGADLQVVSQDLEKALPAWAVVTIALAGIGAYVVCVLEGPSRCTELAVGECGDGNFEKKVICGVGFDLADNLQLGYHCSYICGNPGPSPGPGPDDDLGDSDPYDGDGGGDGGDNSPEDSIGG